MDAMKLEMLNQLFADKSFVKQMKSAGTIEEIRAVIADRGIELTELEIEEMLRACEKYAFQEEELSDAQMEGISGGVVDPVTGACIVGFVMLGAAYIKGLLKKKNR